MLDGLASLLLNSYRFDHYTEGMMGCCAVKYLFGFRLGTRKSQDQSLEMLLFGHQLCASVGLDHQTMDPYVMPTSPLQPKRV